MAQPTRNSRICVIVLALALGAAAAADVASTRHNLSVSGPGPLRAATESRICVFCHTPHNAAPSSPLWNRGTTGSTYIPYTSSTALSAPGQPTGASLMCLSCHDGTVALGEVLSRDTPIAMAGGAGPIPAGPSRIGTDLSDDHPVSFRYDAALAAAHGELTNPAALTGPVTLDPSGEMQCTSCHDPHDDTYGMFLVMPNTASALCTTCHAEHDWNLSAHRLSGATWNGAGPDPWPHTGEVTVAANACENCHQPHGAPSGARLLNALAEEDNCYPCHNGNVAATDIEGVFAGKLSIHPVTLTTGVHDPVEPAVSQTRHVECVDCHDAHAANGAPGSPPGSLAGARGVTITGAGIEPVTAEYQICLRCHGDSPGLPPASTTRQLAQLNVRLEFDTGNPSHHAVAGPGVNPNVPSLIPPWTTASVITCGDCHNNDTGPGAGGAGPAGPHGSNFPNLLERRYETTDPTNESPATYALCYKCHSRNSLFEDESGFPHHQHVADLDTPCNVCHDPHGVSATQGNSINNPHLLNFDLNVVQPSAGRLRFESLGVHRGQCYMVCHGADHDPFEYGG